MSDSFTRFINIIREIFQFDTADLDFGIYRILNEKREQIEDYLNDRLPQVVDQAFAQYTESDREKLQEQLDALRQQLENAAKVFGQPAFDESGDLVAALRGGEVGKEYLAVQGQLEQIEASADLKRSVYNDLANFFERYYQDGDYISKRKRGRDEKYVIPYDGQEVVLYWANQDQYYVKTGEQFRNYRFKAGEYIVQFELRSASTAQNNNKGNRYFILAGKDAIHWDEPVNTLTLYFEYRLLTDKEQQQHGRTAQQQPQDSLNSAAATAVISSVRDATLKAHLAQVKEGEERNVLLKHLTQFTRRNTADFFIHKDLAAFLLRELEFFIKNEVLLLDDLIGGAAQATGDQIRRARVVRDVGHSIITLLAQIEDFQKRLFEKKKFATRTEYCVTVDRVPEELWPQILANEDQLAEWHELFALDDLLAETPLLNNGISEATLRQYPALVVDTRHFDQPFKEALLASFDDLDEATDGILINSENFQALNLILESYREQVKCIYIDPPYNTGEDGFLYRDNYQHSSWLTMIQNRAALAKDLLPPDGIFLVSIHDDEQHRLRTLCSDVFGENNFLANLVWKSRQNVDSRAKNNISNDHEFILAYGQAFRGAEKDLSKYSNPDNDPRGPWMSDNMVGLRSKRDRPNLHYDILVGLVEALPDNGLTGTWKVGEYELIVNSLTELNQESGDIHAGSYIFAMGDTDGFTFTARFVGNMSHLSSGMPVPANIYPCTDKGWRYEPKSMAARILDKRIIWPESETGRPRKKTFLKELKSAYTGFSSVVGYTRDGTIELKEMFGEEVLAFPKPTSLLEAVINQAVEEQSVVLDFFAGSGTTAHAVINLNREDGGDRKYILVEMGEYFETVLLPRIKRVVFSDSWKDGKPQGSSNGVSQLIKYHTLEQYEDTLNNLERPRQQEGQLAFAQLGDPYLLRYMLDFETQGSPSLLNIEALQSPFEYKLAIQNGLEAKETTVDLVETFNYLLGLVEKQRRAFDHDGRRYVAVWGTQASGRSAASDNIVIVWRITAGIVDNEEGLLADRDFICDTIIPAFLGDGWPDRLLVNGMAIAERDGVAAESLDGLFHQLMFAGVEA